MQAPSSSFSSPSHTCRPCSSRPACLNERGARTVPVPPPTPQHPRVLRAHWAREALASSPRGFRPRRLSRSGLAPAPESPSRHHPILATQAVRLLRFPSAHRQPLRDRLGGAAGHELRLRAGTALYSYVSVPSPTAQSCMQEQFVHSAHALQTACSVRALCDMLVVVYLLLLLDCLRLRTAQSCMQDQLLPILLRAGTVLICREDSHMPGPAFTAV